MTTRGYLAVLRERWLVLVAAVLVCLIAAVTTWSLTPKQYTASLIMYVSSTGQQNPQAAQSSQEVAHARTTSYVALVTSDRVMGDVVRSLGLPLTPQELATQVSVSTPTNSAVIDIYATSSSSKQAASIANAVGEALTTLAAEIDGGARIGELPDGPTAVTLGVIQPAVAPARPSSTGLSVAVALGVLAGLVVGALGAILLDAADRRIRSAAQLRTTAGLPVLGQVHGEVRPSGPPLLSERHPLARESEMYRGLRAKLQFFDTRDDTRVVSLTAATRGEGVTTTTIDLAIAMAAAGQSVLVIDADRRQSGATRRLGLADSPGLTDVLGGAARLHDAVQPWVSDSPEWAPVRLSVLARGADRPDSGELVPSGRLGSLLDEARASYDIVLVDAPDVLSLVDGAIVSAATDATLLVCRCKKVTTDQVAAVLEALSEAQANVVGAVLITVRGRIGRRLRAMRRQRVDTVAAPEPRSPASDVLEARASEVHVPEPEPYVPEWEPESPYRADISGAATFDSDPAVVAGSERHPAEQNGNGHNGNGHNGSVSLDAHPASDAPQTPAGRRRPSPVPRR